MLKPSSKVYYVYVFGGEYEDKWELPVGVCPTLDLAEKLKRQTEDSYTIECKIPEDEYNRMVDYLYDYEEKNGMMGEDFCESLAKLFPKYSLKDIETAESKYNSYNDFGGVMIEEIGFYNGTNS